MLSGTFAFSIRSLCSIVEIATGRARVVPLSLISLSPIHLTSSHSVSMSFLFSQTTLLFLSLWNDQQPVFLIRLLPSCHRGGRSSRRTGANTTINHSAFFLLLFTVCHLLLTTFFLNQPATSILSALSECAEGAVSKITKGQCKPSTTENRQLELLREAHRLSVAC